MASVCLPCRHVSQLEKRLRLYRHDALTPEQTDKPSLIPFQREKFDVSSHSSRKSILFSFFLLILEDLHKDLDVYP